MTSSEGLQHHFNFFLLFSHQKEFSCHTYIFCYTEMFISSIAIWITVWYTISAASSARHFDLVSSLLVEQYLKWHLKWSFEIPFCCTSKEVWTIAAFLFQVTHLIKILWNVGEMNSSAWFWNVDSTRIVILE